jgi:hypothetical protein
MDSTGGPLMPDPEEYRQYAKLCADLANLANDKIERGALLQIAHQWRRLANYRVKRELRKDAAELLTAASQERDLPKGQKLKPTRNYVWYRTKFVMSKGLGSSSNLGD